jgi:hypothetical protein
LVVTVNNVTSIVGDVNQTHYVIEWKIKCTGPRTMQAVVHIVDAWRVPAQRTEGVFVQEDGEVVVWTATVAKFSGPDVSNSAVVTFGVFSKRLAAIVFDLGFK